MQKLQDFIIQTTLQKVGLKIEFGSHKKPRNTFSFALKGFP